MIDVSVQIEGLDELVAMFTGAATNLSSILDGAVDEAADEMVRIIQNMPPVNVQNNGWDALGVPVAPKYGGTLRQSVHKEITAPMERTVGPDTDYADFVFLGTSKTEPRPYLVWALEDFGGYEAIERIVQQTIDRVFEGSGTVASVVGSIGLP